MVFKESSFTEAGLTDCSFLYLLVFNKMFNCLLNFLGHLKIPIIFIEDHMHDEGSLNIFLYALTFKYPLHFYGMSLYIDN